NFSLGKVADTHFRHHRNGDRGHDFANHFDRGHSGPPAFFTDVRRHALERHHRACSCLFRDARLLGVGDVHDNAALEHLREPNFYAPLVGICVVTAAVYLLRVHVPSPHKKIESQESCKLYAAFGGAPITTTPPRRRASRFPAASRISPIRKRFLPVSLSCQPSTTISAFTGTGFLYSTE